jgi:hypothetical protein
MQAPRLSLTSFAKLALHQQAMCISRHEPETVDENTAVSRARTNQVREILSLHNTDIFQSGDGVVSELDRPLFDFRKPSREAGKIEWILLARINEERLA